MIGAVPADSGVEVILESGIAPSDVLHRLQRGFGQRRAAQIGVQHHAGGVDYGAKTAPLPCSEPVGHLSCPVALGVVPASAGRRHGVPCGIQHFIPGCALQ